MADDAGDRTPSAGEGRRGLRLDDLLRPGATVAPAAVSPGYALAAMGALATIVLVIAVYLALIALVGWAVYLHATADLWLLKPAGVGGYASGRGRGYLLQMLAYATPIAAGVVVIVFMLKPLFARRTRESWPVPLTREDQPAVFGAVERIAAALGSPLPAAIEVDCNANASARLERGGLILRIGLPLAQGLTLREMLGVVAHELGHFRQGAGMRISWSVRRLVVWLLEAVYRRDRLDLWLDECARGDSFWIILPAQFARLCVWLSRRVLWLLAHLAMLVVSSLLRQMEYDADRAEVAIAGVKAYVSTAQALPALAVADSAARHRVIENLAHQQLPDDLSALAAEERQRFDATTVERIRSAAHSEKTGLFDSHPCQSERIAAARKVGGEGIIAIDAPGTALFRHFETLAKVATVAEYRERLGAVMDRMSLVPVQGVVAAAKADDNAVRTVERYFGMPLHPRRALLFTESHPQSVTDVEAALQRWATVRSEHIAAARAVKPYADEWDAATGRVRIADLADRMRTAGLTFSHAQLGVQGSPASIAESREQGRIAADAAGEHVERTERLGVERMQWAMRMLSHPGGRARLAIESDADAKRIEASVRLYAPVLASLGRAHATALRVAEERGVLMAILQGISGKPSEKQVKAAMDCSRELRKRLAALRELLGGIPSPFPHGGTVASREGATVADVLVPELPPDSDPGAVADAAGNALKGIDHFRDRVAGRLIHAVLKVEAAAFGASPQGRATAGTVIARPSVERQADSQ